MIIRISVHSGRELDREPTPQDYPINEGPLVLKKKALDQFDIWLEDEIKADNPLVCNAMNHIAEKALEPEGINLVCTCQSIICHGHIIRNHVIDAFKKAYPEAFPEKKASWRKRK